MIQYGTKVVAGVTPGKGGKSHLDVPIFGQRSGSGEDDPGRRQRRFRSARPGRAGAMIEAIEAEMPLVVAVTERVPVLDMIRVREALAGSRTRLVGPNSQGVLAPGVCQVGVMATDRAYRGTIGVVSRSASLTSEVISQLTAAGLGQSETIGSGRPRPWHELRRLPEAVLRGSAYGGRRLDRRIGGTEEQQAADYIRGADAKKPVVSVGRREACSATTHAPRRRAGSRCACRRRQQDCGVAGCGRGHRAQSASCRSDHPRLSCQTGSLNAPAPALTAFPTTKHARRGMLYFNRTGNVTRYTRIMVSTSTPLASLYGAPT